jgi:hypothetical protein
VADGFSKSIEALGIGYIDLFVCQMVTGDDLQALTRPQLMHWPQAEDAETGKTIPYGSAPSYNDTWHEMEKLVGPQCRAIG